MYAIGDRKLTLEPSLKETDTVGLERHEYKFLDQDGNDVGFLELYPDAAKKQLYIGMIGGKAGLYSNSFGPSLIRDLKRQLKELYPEYETITGHRVTGARYADKWFNENLDQRNPTDHPVVKLSLDARRMANSATPRWTLHPTVLPRHLRAYDPQADVAGKRASD